MYDIVIFVVSLRNLDLRILIEKREDRDYYFVKPNFVFVGEVTQAGS